MFIPNLWEYSIASKRQAYNNSSQDLMANLGVNTSTLVHWYTNAVFRSFQIFSLAALKLALMGKIVWIENKYYIAASKLINIDVY